MEEGVTEVELYTAADRKVEVAESQSEKEVQRRGSCWLGAGLCWEVVCTCEVVWRTGEEWTAEEGESKLERGANERVGCPPMADVGSCGAKCRWVSRDGCRWGSEEQGRIYSG